MFALRILNGRTAGQEVLIRRFPFLVGRSARAHLRLDAAGVWEEHLRLAMDSDKTVQVAAVGPAIVRLNGETVATAALRTGDVIELGGSRVQFWLGPVAQKGVRWRETTVWLALAGVTLIECILAFGLPQ
ncbi:MAG: hypothetical protein H7A45_03630 [Verrucomicrobiales bacterium]|nr:hypothetical protein [Verrucomicrobiales bacterium]